MKLVQSTSLLLLLAAAVVAAAPGQSDLTVRTRSTWGARAGAVETVTLQVTASRMRETRLTELSNGTRASAMTNILQCDQHRELVLNDLAKIYAVESVPRAVTASGAVLRAGRGSVVRRSGEVRTIDAVDTGERRVFGPVTARHIVTTTTSERDGVAPHVVAVRDGWYIDAPSRTCDSRGDVATAILVAGNGGTPEVRWRGRARTGFALEERDRMFEGPATLERKTELVDISGAPIPASAFEIPGGYEPALEMPGGGRDLTRPDTLVNRVTMLWSLATSWVRSFWQ